MIKKYLSALLVGCCLLSFGSSKTVDEFKFYPASYLRFWENNLKNYWRYENSEKEKKSDPGVEIILNEFLVFLSCVTGGLVQFGKIDEDDPVKGFLKERNQVFHRLR